ncbi:MAG: PTS sugar transporter subunit IIA [Clostridia bacterium]
MFFKKKSKELELLSKANIKPNSNLTSKEEVIKTLGQMLVDTGYVGAEYVNGMLEREESFSTYMGCGLAIPHGVEKVKNQVKISGLAVMTFPNGVSWGEEDAKIVVAIASKGEEHLEILSNISEKIIDEEISQKLINGDVDTIYNILTGKG